MKDRRGIITGASKGIGKAIATRLGSMGANLVIHYHSDQKGAEQVADLVRSSGGKAIIIQADLSKQEEVLALADKAWDSLGEIDFLINNAGVSYKKSFLQTTREDVETFFSLNFRGTFLLTQQIAKKMVEAGITGDIATITSINALQPGIGLSAYGASKGAVESLMKGVALELAAQGIRVNTFAVGAIETDMNKNVWSNPELLKTVEEKIPMGRLGQPEEIAAVVCDLLNTATYMTGATITIDGGWTLKRGYNSDSSFDKK